MFNILRRNIIHVFVRPSDSDSEMETRLREAAVSVKDLLRSSGQPSTLSPASTEPPCSENKKKKAAGGEERHVVKKKMKRKQNQEEHAEVDSAGSPVNAESNGEHGSSEQEHTQVKVKRKRKKKKKLKENAVNEALNWSFCD